MAALAVVFAAGIISGMAAFGFALVAVPPLLLIYDPPTVTTLCLLLVMVTRLVVLKDVFQAVEWRVAAIILPPAWLGTFIGLALLRTLDSAAIELIAGSAVVISSVAMLSGWRIPRSESNVAGLAAGLGSGILSTTSGMAGPPMVLLFTSRRYSAHIFRGTLTVIFYALSLASLAQLARDDLIDRSDFRTTLVLLPAAAVGTVVGQRLLRRVSASQFTRLVLLLLIVTGSLGVASALFHLLG
ncbi:MAG: sulfite exporter TauE/SafE family protein [Thermomicrobiales bacterium]